MEVNGDQQWESKDARPRKKEVGLIKVVSEYRSRFSEGENEKNSKVKKDAHTSMIEIAWANQPDQPRVNNSHTIRRLR